MIINIKIIIVPNNKNEITQMKRFVLLGYITINFERREKAIY